MTFVSDLILMSIATRSNQQQLITGRFGRVGLSTVYRNCSGTQSTKAYAAETSCNLIDSAICICTRQDHVVSCHNVATNLYIIMTFVLGLVQAETGECVGLCLSSTFCQ